MYNMNVIFKESQPPICWGSEEGLKETLGETKADRMSLAAFGIVAALRCVGLDESSQPVTVNSDDLYQITRLDPSAAPGSILLMSEILSKSLSNDTI